MNYKIPMNLLLGAALAALGLAGCSEESSFTTRTDKRPAWLGGTDKGAAASADALVGDSSDNVTESTDIVVSDNIDPDNVPPATDPDAIPDSDVVSDPDTTPDSDPDSNPDQSTKPPKATRPTDDAEKDACAKNFGMASKDVVDVFKLSRSAGPKAISASSIIVVKLTGNQTHLDLSVSGSDGANTVRGICVFLAGNQSQLNLKLSDVKVAKIVHTGRGNQSKLSVDVSKNAEVIAASADLKGNKSTMTYSGEGKHP